MVVATVPLRSNGIDGQVIDGFRLALRWEPGSRRKVCSFELDLISFRGLAATSRLQATYLIG